MYVPSLAASSAFASALAAASASAASSASVLTADIAAIAVFFADVTPDKSAASSIAASPLLFAAVSEVQFDDE